MACLRFPVLVKRFVLLEEEMRREDRDEIYSSLERSLVGSSDFLIWNWVEEKSRSARVYRRLLEGNYS